MPHQCTFYPYSPCGYKDPEKAPTVDVHKGLHPVRRAKKPCYSRLLHRALVYQIRFEIVAIENVAKISNLNCKP